jgi:peptidoglycan/xylan/chitin deacetylase (PgdA/CDA1 family)
MLNKFFVLCSVGALLSVTGCRERKFNESSDEGGADVAAIKRDPSNAGKIAWVDTHDFYSHAFNHKSNVTDQNFVNPARFPYFKLRSDGKRGAALTMDCAWVNHKAGMEIIDLLKANKVHATFFISGPFLFSDSKYTQLLTSNPERLAMIRRMVEDGHEFGNHTVHHYSLFKTEDDGSHTAFTKQEEELARIPAAWNAMVKAAFGNSPVPANAVMKPYWRAPYGEYGDGSHKGALPSGKVIVIPDTLSIAARAGFPHHFGWNVDVRDTVGSNSITATSMTNSVLSFLAKQKSAAGDALPAFVILAHLSNEKRWGSSPAGLERLLKDVRGYGYEWSKLSEIYALESAKADPEVAHPDSSYVSGP